LGLAFGVDLLIRRRMRCFGLSFGTRPARPLLLPPPCPKACKAAAIPSNSFPSKSVSLSELRAKFLMSSIRSCAKSEGRKAEEG
jgi:hypothetical protein